MIIAPLNHITKSKQYTHESHRSKSKNINFQNIFDKGNYKTPYDISNFKKTFKDFFDLHIE